MDKKSLKNGKESNIKEIHPKVTMQDFLMFLGAIFGASIIGAIAYFSLLVGLIAMIVLATAIVFSNKE